MNNQPERPVALQVSGKNLPKEIRSRKRWCCWSYEDDDEKHQWKKRPEHPKTGNLSWHTRYGHGAFEDAWTRYHTDTNVDGLGFVFKPTGGFVPFDLDKCRDENGQIQPWAEDVVQSLNSYTELSPSGRGLHILVKGTKPDSRTHLYIDGHKIEVITNGFVTLTGQRLEGLPKTIEPRQAEIDALFARWTNTPSGDPNTPLVLPPGVGIARLSDDEVIEKWRRTDKTGQFSALFDIGDISRYNSDDSRADLALCKELAFWCCGDAE